MSQRYSADINHHQDLRLRAKTLAESEHVTPPPEMDVTVSSADQTTENQKNRFIQKQRGIRPCLNTDNNRKTHSTKGLLQSMVSHSLRSIRIEISYQIPLETISNKYLQSIIHRIYSPQKRPPQKRSPKKEYRDRIHILIPSKGPSSIYLNVDFGRIRILSTSSAYRIQRVFDCVSPLYTPTVRTVCHVQSIKVFTKMLLHPKISRYNTIGFWNVQMSQIIFLTPPLTVSSLLFVHPITISLDVAGRIARLFLCVISTSSHLSRSRGILFYFNFRSIMVYIIHFWCRT